MPDSHAWPGAFQPNVDERSDERKLRAAIAAAAVPPEEAGFSGVYFLLREGSVVYVGQSENVLARIYRHRVEYDAYAFLPFPIEALDRAEAHYARLLDPPDNGRHLNGKLRLNPVCRNPQSRDERPDAQFIRAAPP